MTGYGVGFPKGSPYIDEVNAIILELQNNGYYIVALAFYLLAYLIVNYFDLDSLH